MTTYSSQCPRKFHAPEFGLSIQSNFPPDVLQIKCGLALYVLQRYASSSSLWSKCCGLTRRSELFFTTISTSKKMFLSERDQERDTKKGQELYITFSQPDWFSAQNERFWLAITARNSRHKNSESNYAKFIHENTTSAVQLLQIFKQNYNHFATKHTHWYLQWWSHRKRYLERPNTGVWKKKGMAHWREQRGLLSITTN